MLTLSSWPQAILHVDSDAFFATCEQALHPEFRGKPVITGKERGIVACPSYESRRVGVKRAMRLSEAKRLCPQAIILPSDYETYSLMSCRLFAIMKRFTPMVEEYSIDEGFADLTGLRRIYRTSYQNIADSMKKEIEKELGITVSVGLSLSKSLAKLASNRERPSGFTAVPGWKIHHLLAAVSLGQIWGFGPNTVALLTKMGVKNALDFVNKPQSFAERLLGKVGGQIWRELRGEYVYKVITKEKHISQSISKVTTFSPPSSDKRYIYSQLIGNLESACFKARRYKLAASRVYVYLRLHNFDGCGIELRLSQPSNHPIELAPFVRRGFDQIFEEKKRYRATGVILSYLTSMRGVQPTLFDDPTRLLKIEGSSKAMDTINRRFGKQTVHLASSLAANLYKRYQGKVARRSHCFIQRDKGNTPRSQKRLRVGKTRSQRLKYPMLFMKV